MDEATLMADADRRAAHYLSTAATAAVFPGENAIAALDHFQEGFPETGRDAGQTLALLDEMGSPATVRSNGPNYFGFVVGASLPAAAAADRLMVAWDQCASSFDNAPVAATIEKIAGKWVLEALDLPSESAVGFGTSATACTLTCLTAARRALLARSGWDFDRLGLGGAPEIQVMVSEMVHITVKKALRIMGFGLDRLVVAPTDAAGRIDLDRLPPITENMIICLQAGEVNGGGFDPFAPIMDRAEAVGAWVHVDGAFGLWARACDRLSHLTKGVERADSWTTDGHKWLNTPYDGAMAICRDAKALYEAMNSDAPYSMAEVDAQKNLTLEFSRRARGIPIWAALRTLGRDGLSRMIGRHHDMAKYLSDRLRDAGFDILNEVVLNQVLVRGRNDMETAALQNYVEKSGEAWFGRTIWRGQAAFRLSVSSWRTGQVDIDRLVGLLVRARHAVATGEGAV